MSETFEKVLVKDDRIGCLTPQLKYQVFKGGQNITGMPFKAISQTTSAHVFNVPVPSLETVISREVLWSSIVTLRIRGSNLTNPALPKDPNGFLVNYGVTDALAPFPLHSLVATMTATINNNTVAMNVADVLAPLLRLLDPEEMAYYDDSTPTTLDYLGNYRDGIDAMNFSINTIGAAANPPNPQQFDTLRPVVYVPGDQVRVPPAPANVGDVPVFWGTGPQVYQSYPNNVLSYDMNRTAGTGKKHRPRGSFRLLNIWAPNGAGGRRLPLQGDNEVFVRFQVVEPLLLSPFIFGSGHGKQGFYGIQTMNFQMNLLSNANRAWRSVQLSNTVNGNNTWIKTADIDSFEDSTLYFQFLTPHASEMLQSRNVVPFFELPVYRTVNFPPIAGRGNGQALNGTGGFVEGGFQTLSSANIQLAGIPDKLIIFVRRNLGLLNCTDTDRFLTIEGIRINFNNQSGLLSSMSQLQLYKNAVLSGLVNMSWDEFSGLTVSVSGNNNSPFSEPFGPFSGVGARPGNGVNVGAPGFKYVATTGSVLVLNFGEVIQLTDEYYAPGSLGTFNLQITLDVRNNHQDDWDQNSYEMVIIPMNSGTFVNERGTSSTFTTLLTRQEVLDSLQQPAYSNHQIHRMIGGGFLDNLKSSLGWVRSKANEILPHVKTALGAVGNAVPGAQVGANVLGALGYGVSGGRRRIADRVAG